MPDIDAMVMELIRLHDDGSVQSFEILGDYDGYTLVFNFDADVEIGDLVSYDLPNGKTRRLRITELQEIQELGVLQDFPCLGARAKELHTKPLPEGVSAWTPRQPKHVDMGGVHPSISSVSQSQVASGHYDSAVFDAFKAVEDRVQQLTGRAQSGKPLMASVFHEQNPALDITSDTANEAQKADEREGFKFLFMGAAQGLRNPRAHGANLQTTEQEAMEKLATASLLMRALDRAENRLPPQQGLRLLR